MSVRDRYITQQFAFLNQYRPRGAVSGEVVCIELRHRHHGTEKFLGYAKRKSVHVPPSSNCYWNWKALESLIVAWFTERGTSRELRREWKRMLNEAVKQIHLYEVRSFYGLDASSGLGKPHQYWAITLDTTCEENAQISMSADPLT